MTKHKTLIVVLLMLSSVPALLAQTNVLFLGNSYTGVNDLPSLVRQVALSAGDTLVIQSRTPGGRQIAQHAQDPQVHNLLRSKKWDYVVIQCQSQEPSLNNGYLNANVLPYAKALCDSIRKNNVCSVPLFYMTWGRKNGDASNCNSWPPVCTYRGMDSMLYMNYQRMGKENNAEVSPVGAVWRRLRDSTNLELYSPDESHPSYVGSMAAAYTFYTAITRKNPNNITYQIGLKPTEAEEIKKAVEAVLFHKLDTFNIGVMDPKSDFTYEQDDCSFVFKGKDGFDSYLWDFGDGTASNAPSRTKTYQSSGSYWVKLKVTRCGITHVDSHQVSCTELGLNEIDNRSPLIYPNPSSGSFVLSNGLRVESVQTLDGKSVAVRKNVNKANTYSVSEPIKDKILVLHLVTQHGKHVYQKMVVN